jgi:VWFA-related protein
MSYTESYALSVKRKQKNLPMSTILRHIQKAIQGALFIGPLGLASQLPAQTAQVPLITVTARLVVLDVVATGKDGKPVEGLTAKDFQVFEDGKPQRIRSVELPSAHTLPADTVTAGADAVFDPASPASFGRSPVNVLILDQLNTHFADSSFARRELHDYLAKQPALLPQPTTLLTVYDSRFKELQGFTRDRDLLLKALASAPTKYAWQLEINKNTEYGPIERLDQSLRALEQIAQNYARIPGRKNLIWVGGGFPTIAPTSLDDADAQEVKDTLQHVTDVLLDTRVTLYAVDPSSNAAGMTEITDPTQALFADAAGDTLSGSFDPFGSTDDFDNLGPITGGRVVRGRNDIAQSIASSVELGNNFYTIAYTPDSTNNAEAKYRKIKVVCTRPGVTTTTRNGYYSGQSQQDKSNVTAAYDLSTAAQGTMPLNGLHITIQPDPEGTFETYQVRVAAPDLTWKTKEDGSAVASVYVMAVSLNAKGKLLGHTLHGMKATAKPGTDLHDPSHSANFSFTASPAPKATMLRFIVRDSATGRMGSFDLSLTKH